MEIHNIFNMPAFNFYYDMLFWPFFCAVVVMFRFLSMNLLLRNLFLLLASIFMVLALPNFHLFSLIFIICEALLVFYVGYYLINNSYLTEQSRRYIVAASMVFILISAMFLFKYKFFQQLLLNCVLPQTIIPSHPLFILGISYFSFKMIHFVVDCYKQKIKTIGVLNFLIYIFFFPAFTSGPINRYNHFVEQLTLKLNDKMSSDIKSGSERIVHGLFKKLVLAAIVFPYTSALISRPIHEASFAQVVLGMYAYTLYIYFDFSGYSDIAIGCAKIMGIALPENFNNPFLKKNIQQLWANWHMSLTQWLTEYVYWPLTKYLRKLSYFGSRPILLSNISIIGTFVVCGMWHGEGFNFVLWGLYHGLGLAGLNTYQKFKRKIRNKRLRGYFSSKYSTSIGIFLTFNFFVVGILFFSLDINKLSFLIHKFL